METISHATQTKAIKDHRCNFCCEVIEKGTTYLRSTHSHDGDIYSWKTHEPCAKIAEKLKMYDNVDEGLGSEDFIENIKEEYNQIMSDTQNELYESESFTIPKFKDRLLFVINFYGIK